MLNDLVPQLDESFMHAAGAIPLVFQGALRTMPQQERQSQPSRHDSHELTYVRRGKIRYTLGKKDYLVTTGNTIVIKPGREHSFRIVDRPVDHLRVRFARRPEAAARQLPEPAVSPVSVEEFFRFADGVNSADDDLIDDCFLIEAASRNRLPVLPTHSASMGRRLCRDLLLRARSVELVVVVARAIKGAQGRSLRVRLERRAKAGPDRPQYIGDHFDRDISVADAASYVFLSQGYFARAFRDELGTSPMAYLIRIRVERSCELLRQPDMKVSSIAARVGFSSPQRFNAAFRKQMGMTPMQYRRQFTD